MSKLVKEKVFPPGTETSTFQPPSNDPGVFIPSSFEGIFSKSKKKVKKRDKRKSPKKMHKEKNNEMSSKKKNKEMSSKTKNKEMSSKKKNKEMSSKKKHRKKHNEVISEKKHKKRISKSKEYVLMDDFENHKKNIELDTNSLFPNHKRNISDSDSYSLYKSYETGISSSDRISSLAIVKAGKHSANTLNLHLYCGNEESKVNDTHHQKSCPCSNCVTSTTNTVNLHLHCKSQTLLKISVPEENSDSGKTNDSNHLHPRDTFCEDSLSLKSKSTSRYRTRNFPVDHGRSINTDLFVHYKDLKYLTVLDDGTFVVNRPQPKKIKSQSLFVRKFETTSPECEKQNIFIDSQNSNLQYDRTIFSQESLRTDRHSAWKSESYCGGVNEDDFEDSVNVKLEDGWSSAAKPYPSTSSSISTSHDSIYNNYSVLSTVTNDKKPLMEYESPKCSNFKESFGRKDLKHLSIKDGVFVLQLPERESGQSSSESVPKSSCTQSKEYAGTSSSSLVHCKKESFSKNDLKHLKINKDGTFYLELSDSKTKKSSSAFSPNSSQYTDFCEKDKDLKASVDGLEESFMTLIHENDLERLKINPDGSFSLESSNFKVNKPSTESSDSSSHSALFCEKKSFSKSDLKCLKINKNGTFSLDLSDSKTDKPLSDPVDTSTSSSSLCEKTSFSKSDLKHLKINKDGSFILEVP